MLSINLNAGPKIALPAVSETKKDPVADDKNASASPLDETKGAEGVVVTISGAGMKASGAAKSPNNDIDESGLDDNVKQMLKMIRQLRQQIAEKQAELAAVQADKSMTPEQAQARTSALQGELSSLQAALMGAQASMSKVIKTLDPQSALKASSLMMS